jgi:hypothetical protein
VGNLPRFSRFVNLFLSGGGLPGAPAKKSPFPGSGSIPIQKNGVYWDRRKIPFGPTIAKEKIRPEAADKEAVMSELLVLIGVVAAWYLIQGVILPRMGVST